MGRAQQFEERVAAEMKREKKAIRVEIIDPNGNRHGPFSYPDEMDRYCQTHFSPLPVMFDGKSGFELQIVGAR